MPTPINLCNHAYWNLSGDFKQPTIANHKLKLNSTYYLPLDETQIPTKEVKAVESTPFDFRILSTIADNERLSGAINGGGKPGIDHPFVVDGSEKFDVQIRDVAELVSDTRRMTIKSTHPVVVAYTTNWLPKEVEFTPNHPGGIHRMHAAICLETC